MPLPLAVARVSRRFPPLRGPLAFFCFVFVFVPLVTVLLSTVLGGILAAAEGWTFVDGLFFNVSLLCGLTTPLTSAMPSTAIGTLLLVLIAVWSVGFTAAIIGLVTEYQSPVILLRRLERMLGADRGRPALSFVVLTLIALPSAIMVTSWVLGLCLDGAEGWPPGTGGKYIASNMSMLPTPLVSVSPSTTLGALIDVLVSVLGLSISSTSFALVGAQKGVVSFTEMLDGGYLRRWPLLAFSAAAFLCVPVIVAITTAMGMLLPVAEGPHWTPRDGFLFVASTVCGLGNPLTPLVPESNLGVFVAVLTAVWTMGFVGTLVGVAGAMKWPQKVVRGLEALGARGARFLPRRRVVRPTADAPAAEKGELAHAIDTAGKVVAGAGFAFVGLPLLVLGACVILSLLMAGAEGWSYIDSFLYVTSNALGLPNPLTNIMPAAGPGVAASILIGVFAVVLVSLSMGVLGLFGCLGLLLPRHERAAKEGTDPRQQAAMEMMTVEAPPGDGGRPAGRSAR